MKQPDDLIRDPQSRVVISETGADRGTGERWQHDVFAIEGDRRSRAEHARAIGYVERLFTSGYLDPRQWEAAQRYRDDFDRAGLGPRYSVSQIERVDKSINDLPSVSEGARRRLNRLTDAIGQPGERVLWYMIGCDMSASEVSRRLVVLSRRSVRTELRKTLTLTADFYHLDKKSC